MFVAYSSCDFIPDTTSSEATSRGDGDLVVEASDLGLSPGVSPPAVIDVERSPGVVVRFEGGGRVFYGEEFVGWSYWEEEATDIPGVTPCVNFKVLAG